MFNLKLSDISKERGNYIVNASNTILNLGSGVSGILKRMCPELQNVMWEWLNRNGFLKPGEIAVTPYPCEEFEYAMHAAVMDYRNEAEKINPDYERIEKICKNIAKFLGDKKTKVITPLLGTGVGGLVKAKVYKIMKKHFEKLNAEIILVVHKKEDYDKLILI